MATSNSPAASSPETAGTYLRKEGMLTIPCTLSRLSYQANEIVNHNFYYPSLLHMHLSNVIPDPGHESPVRRLPGALAPYNFDKAL